jgi:hypothetical protein
MEDHDEELKNVKSLIDKKVRYRKKEKFLFWKKILRWNMSRQIINMHLESSLVRRI